VIIIDTTVWSKAYRRRKLNDEDRVIVEKLYDILDLEEEILIGPVRQEILSGISDKNVFNELAIKLDGFNNYEIQLADHDMAAEYYNVCSGKGIQGSQTDYLICAVSHRYNSPIFTLDKDFIYYKKHLSIGLYKWN